MRTPTATAQSQLDAYNAQDLEAFCSHFTDDVQVAELNGAVTLEGLSDYRAKYQKIFGEYPLNKVVLLGRIAIGNVVIDHEQVFRTPNADPFEVAAIYTLRGDEICRVDFAK